MYGVISMDLDEQYPDARICFSREEYEDMFNVVARWYQSYPEYIATGILNTPDYLRIFDMDYERIGEPCVYIEDGQVFELGDYAVSAI
ncbi:MAG: hypothetical protein JXB00_01075 [Bacteroidales bacterium]|nr:hypothetical protein [Bacteroidales bacterium]